MHRTKLVSALAVAGALVVAAPASAATFTVKNDNGTGTDSLAWAIDAANTTAGHDVIAFDIAAAAAPFEITPPAGIPLPEVTDGVTIDATTQPGYSGPPLVEIDAVNVPNGLVLASDGSLVRGLAIYNAGLGGFGAPNGNGIRILGNGNTVMRNHLGTDAALGALGNNNAGVRVNGTANHIGMPYQGNVIADNLNDGVQVVAGAGNVVEANRIGLNAAGGLLGNLDQGVEISAGGTRVGGNGAPAANVISGNLVSGVRVTAGTGSVISGNKIGTNAAGTVALPNAIGIELGSAAVTVGGSDPGAGNLIAGNTQQGVRVFGDHHSILGNTVGTTALPNQAGIVVRGHWNTIGAGNAIAGNTFDGVRIENGAEGNRVEDGTVSANGRDGVALVHARRSTVEANEIAGNGANGVLIDDENPAGPISTFIDQRVEGNTIEDNGSSGVRIVESHGNAVGEDNVITGNGDDGVTVESGSANAILGNSILNNGDRPIDLNDDGATANDALDADIGANQLTNHPSLGPVNGAGLPWRLDAAPSRSYRLELHAGLACNGGGFSRSVDITTDAAGHAEGLFAGIAPLFVPRYYSVTATAKTTLGLLTTPTDTSELSPCRVVS